MIRSLLLFGLSLVLVGCGQPGAQQPEPPAMLTPAAEAVPAATPDSAAPERLVVLSHDSFSLSQEVLDAFQQETGIVVEFLKAGDTGTALNQAILSRDAPLADVFFGVDNTFMGRALAADLFIPFDAPALSQLPSDLLLDPERRLLPVDVGYVLINYDKAALAAAGLAPPSRLEALTEPQWQGKLVVQNPATSSPGLAFLLATIAHFGESGAYSWRDFWRDLRANEVYVSPDWSDAYYNQFSGGSGQGSYPLVVSYSTSPAAEVFFSDGALSEPPTGNLLVPGGVFRQIEFVGILRGTPREEAARAFVNFMLQPRFQADIPLQMFVYPANPAVALPEVFVRFAEVPPQPVGLSPAQIEAGREGWLEEWTQIVLR